LGIGWVSRLIQTRSPNTHFDAHRSVVAGFAKRRGLSHVHPSTKTNGTVHHQPIQVWLQPAKMSSGSTVARDHTLHGFAWRIHVSSSIRNTVVIQSSTAGMVLGY
jgi:hypothetical protein